VLFVHLLFQHALVLLQLFEPGIRVFQLLLQLLQSSVTDFSYSSVIALTFSLLLLDVSLVHMLLDGAYGLNQFLLSLPPKFLLRRLFAQLAELFFNQSKPFARGGIFLLT